jgi:hypothetical protein
MKLKYENENLRKEDHFTEYEIARKKYENENQLLLLPYL